MMKLLKHLKKKDWLYIMISVVFIFLQVFLDLKLPEYMTSITVLIKTEGSPINAIIAQGGRMMLCALGSLSASVIVGFFAANVAASLAKYLRELTFAKTLDFSMEEINMFSTSSLITRSTNDIAQIQTTIAMGLQVLVKAPILAVWAILKIVGKSWYWVSLTAGAVVILVLLVGTIIIFAVPKFKIVQTLMDKINLIAREHLTGIRVVRAYNAEKYQKEKFDVVNEEYSGVNLFISKIMSLMQPGMRFIMSFIPLGIYWIGAYLINDASGNAQLDIFSDMVVFSSYAIQVVMAFMMLIIIFMLIPRAAVSAARINEILDTKTKIIDGTIDNVNTAVKGKIEFRNVNFKYPDADEYILRDVSFYVEQGETVAFIGSTGSGKSTIVKLISRLYDATDGEIIIDDFNIKDYQQEILHNKLGYVTQSAVLFSGTVNSNIAFGDSGMVPTSDQIKYAAKIAQGSDFIESMPKQYDSKISRGGSNLSGGQKQRVSIARAICKKPEIFVFDDSFSALDYQTDQKLRTELNKETHGITKLIVAQRIGTIKDADKIIVLDKGEVVGIGKHKALLDTCEVYKEIAYSQLSEEELKIG